MSEFDIHQPNVKAKIILPPLYEAQKIFGHWDVWHPNAQVLVAPSGTKVGKSYGSAMWLTKRSLIQPGSYNAWIGPTYLKSKIGLRYIKSFLPQITGIDIVDGNLEVKIDNGAYMKFLHGKDAETTVEGEAVDNFVIDESGKQERQLWYSLLTTLTQTKGKGIVTGTPRGFTWYYEVFRAARSGDPFYCHAQLPTRMSPYVTPEAIENARRILPKALFDQYYEALFVSGGEVFGDLTKMWDESLRVEPKTKLWIHPDASARALDTVTGWDIAKQRDYSVFYTTNIRGQLVGYARFRHVNYEAQVDRLAVYFNKYFSKSDKSLRYDATGVGNAVGEMIVDKDIDASITAVMFTNKSKQEMVSRSGMAIDAGWHRAPRIEEIEHEMGSFEVTTTKSGLFQYSAPEGEHDDIVCAAILSISGAYQCAQADEADKVYEAAMSGNLFKETDTDDFDDDSEDETDELADDSFFDDIEDELDKDDSDDDGDDSFDDLDA